MEQEQSDENVIIQFRSAENKDELTGPQLSVPISSSEKQLETLVNHLLENEEKLPYSFYVNDTVEIVSTLNQIIEKEKISTEEVITILYQPQSIFKVRAVTRCAGDLIGHTEAVLSVAFSPDGTELCTASGDTTVRFWDIYTMTPFKTCKGHSNWVLYVSWSPDGQLVATGGMDNKILVWSRHGESHGSPLKGHKRYVTCLAWEPFHLCGGDCERLVSGSKDGTLRVWNVRTQQTTAVMSSHTMSISAVKWGHGDGKGWIYSASQDRTIKIWDPNSGEMLKSLQGHGHWVNSLALCTDYVLRTGPFDQEVPEMKPEAEGSVAFARSRVEKILKFHGNTERLVSGSDDITMMLWDPKKQNKPIHKFHGHQQLINHVGFSPDGKYIISASFDKSVKLWDGINGAFIATFRGHVESVYQISWSGDSRLFVSASRDSTVKVWDVRSKKLLHDLPGHADEVYAVDWSPQGERVATGSKDTKCRIWMR